jgi:hypothetical protein
MLSGAMAMRAFQFGSESIRAGGATAVTRRYSRPAAQNHVNAPNE